MVLVLLFSDDIVDFVSPSSRSSLAGTITKGAIFVGFILLILIRQRSGYVSAS